MEFLIVDDETLVGEYVKDLLEKQYPDVQVRMATDCQQAFNAIAERMVDAVLMDLKLIGLSGLDCLRDLRITWPDLPVIIITAAVGEESRAMCLEAGADGFLLKTSMGVLETLDLTIWSAIRTRRGVRKCDELTSERVAKIKRLSDTVKEAVKEK